MSVHEFEEENTRDSIQGHPNLQEGRRRAVGKETQKAHEDEEGKLFLLKKRKTRVICGMNTVQKSTETPPVVSSCVLP